MGSRLRTDGGQAKEPIIKILQDEMWHITDDDGHAANVVDESEFTTVADKIIALFAEAMPTEEEIDNHFNTSPDNHIHPDRYRAEGAKWFRNRMKGGKK